MTTPPREIPFDGFYLISRRVVQRELLLRPEKCVTDLLTYLLAVACEKYGVQIHCATAMSNHFHLVASDPRGVMPDFMRYLDGLSARAINSLRGRWENLWSIGSYGSARIVRSKASALLAMSYVICNPVEAHLVERAKEWPGLIILAHEVGKVSLRVRRPGFFFRAKSKLPEEVVLRSTMPDLEDCSPEEFRKDLIRSCKDREELIRTRAGSQGRGFMGRKRVLSQSPRSFPTSFDQRRCPNPRIFSANATERVVAIRRLQAFAARYREALDKFVRRVADVVFPYGTYKMRVGFNVTCEAPPAPT